MRITLAPLLHGRVWTSWQRAVKLFAERKINTEALISHELPLERFEEGFRATRSGEAIKVLLTPEAR